MGMERSSNSRRSERFGGQGSSSGDGVSQIVLTREEATMMTEIAGGNTRFFSNQAAVETLLRIAAKLVDVKYFAAGEIHRTYHGSGNAIVTGLQIDASEVAYAIRRGHIVVRD